MNVFIKSLAVLATIVLASSCCAIEWIGDTARNGYYSLETISRTIRYNHRARTRMAAPMKYKFYDSHTREHPALIGRGEDYLPKDSMLRLDYDGKPYTRGRIPHRNGIDSLYYNYYDYWRDKHREGYIRYFPLNRKDWRNDTCIAYLTYTSYPQVIDTFMVTRYRVKGKLFRRYRSYENGVEDCLFHPYKERPRAVGYKLQRDALLQETLVYKGIKP